MDENEKTHDQIAQEALEAYKQVKASMPPEQYQALDEHLKECWKAMADWNGWLKSKFAPKD